MTRFPASLTVPAAFLSLLALGCDEASSPASVGERPDAYRFESRFEEGASSVSYSGQTMRFALIEDLAAEIEGLTAAVDDDDLDPADGDVVALLDTFFRFDSEVSGGTALRISTSPPLLQRKYSDISSDKDIVGKLAGNDAETDHRDWSSDFAGWDSDAIATHGGSVTSPEGLVVAFFETLEAQAVARAAGTPAMGPGGEDLPVHVTPTGLDLAELAQKFLLMAVNFSQATDDYLDDDIEGKGILADNANAAMEGDAAAPYSGLEHAWDEAFGYFGAARDFGDYTDEEVAGAGGRPDWQKVHDTDEDGAIDLKTEYNWGLAGYASKRDLGAKAATDYSAEIFDAFLDGRHLITRARGALTADEKKELAAIRNRLVNAWEATLAANTVHYLNATLAQVALFESEEHDFIELAKVWSEMKGFALGFQFNPKSRLSRDDFEKLHELLGDAPALPTTPLEEVVDYQADLREARALLGEAFGFAEENLGDDDGAGGW